MNRIWPLILFFSALAGCCPLASVNPLSDPQNSIYDTRLEGSWRLVSEENDNVFMHFGKWEKGGTELIMVEHNHNGELDLSKFHMFPTVVDKNHYMNVTIKELGNEALEDFKGYIFVKYGIGENDQLWFSLMEQNPIVEAIQQGRLKGKITFREPLVKDDDILKQSPEPNRPIDCVKITDSSLNLIKHIKLEDSKLFKEKMIFKKIKKDF